MTMTDLTPEQAAAMELLSAIGHLVYCNCEMTLIHHVVPGDLAFAGAVEALTVADYGRCPKCLALIRFAHVDGAAGTGPSLVFAFTSKPIADLIPGEAD